MSGYVPLILIMVIFFGMIYFLMIRPMKQRERRHDYLVDHLEEEDIVLTAGGILGEIVSIDEHTVVLKIESGATVRVTKGAIVRLGYDPDENKTDDRL